MGCWRCVLLIGWVGLFVDGFGVGWLLVGWLFVDVLVVLG